MLNNCYVYTYASSLDGLVFYVGKGSGDRIKGHAYEANGKKVNVSRVAQEIRSIWARGGKIIIRKVYDGLWDGEALSLETKLIEQYGYEQLVNDPYHKHRGLIRVTA